MTMTASASPQQYEAFRRRDSQYAGQTMLTADMPWINNATQIPPGELSRS